MVLPIALTLSPGVDVQKTLLQNERGLSVSNLIRHKNGLIQKLGGCQKLCLTPAAATVDALFAWADLDGNPYLAVGTDQRLEVYFAGALYDISPWAQVDNLTTPFATQVGSSIVTVTDAGYGPQPNQWINIVNATYVGGIFLQGLYQIISVGGGTYTFDSGTIATSTVLAGGAVVHLATTNTSSTVAVTLGAYAFTNTQDLTIGVSTTVGGLALFGMYEVDVVGASYSIDAGAAATSTASGYENSGHTRIAYLIPLPIEDAGVGAYGAGAYGAGLYGSGQSSLSVTLVQWFLDKWGENLVAAYATGTIYQWVPPVAP
jgi:hypothetical protein